MRTLIICFVAFTCSFNSAISRWSYLSETTTCNAASGKPGNCKVISDCPDMYALISKPTRTRQELDLLRSVHCGFIDNVPKVCCEEKAASNVCYNPHWQEGTCTSIYQCPNIANLLTPPIPQDLRTYVQSSRCQGPDQYSVCCSEKGPNEIQKPLKKCVTYTAPTDPRTECCGRDGSGDNKIFGGKETAIDEYPWLTLIEYKKNNKLKLLCGGSLISGRYVLTAGHCVAGQVLDVGTPTNVRLGEYDTSTEGPDCVPSDGGGEDCTVGTTVVPIDEIIVHPEYNAWKTGSRHDIALLRLASMVSYTDFVRPICLPTMDYTLNPPLNFTLYAAGWGAISDDIYASKKKLDVDLPFRTLESCQPEYSISKRNVALWKGQLCAGGVKDKDTCKGDSGGPLMYKTNRTIEIIGVVSFGPKFCGSENIPGVYTKVFEYLPWIRSHIRP